MRPTFTRLLILLLILLSASFIIVNDRQAAAQSGRVQQTSSSSSSQKQTATTRDDDGDDDDDKDDEGDAEGTQRAGAADPAALMRAARVVYVKSNTVFVKRTEVEDSLRKRKEFRAWGMSVTRNPGDADLIIEIDRKSLTRRFTFTVLEPRTQTVVTSGKTRSVLFGKKIPNKIAEKFANRVKAVRPYPPTAANP